MYLVLFQQSRAQAHLPDGVASAQANPLGDGTVLTLSFGKLLLGAEGLVALLDGDGLVSEAEKCDRGCRCRLKSIGLVWRKGSMD